MSMLRTSAFSVAVKSAPIQTSTPVRSFVAQPTKAAIALTTQQSKVLTAQIKPPTITAVDVRAKATVPVVTTPTTPPQPAQFTPPAGAVVSQATQAADPILHAQPMPMPVPPPSFAPGEPYPGLVQSVPGVGMEKTYLGHPLKHYLALGGGFVAGLVLLRFAR